MGVEKRTEIQGLNSGTGYESFGNIVSYIFLWLLEFTNCFYIHYLPKFSSEGFCKLTDKARYDCADTKTAIDPTIRWAVGGSHQLPPYILHRGYSQLLTQSPMLTWPSMILQRTSLVAVVKNPPANARDMGSIPGRAPELLEPVFPRAHALRQEKLPQWEAWAP